MRRFSWKTSEAPTGALVFVLLLLDIWGHFTFNRSPWAKDLRPSGGGAEVILLRFHRSSASTETADNPACEILFNYSSLLSHISVDFVV